LNIRNFNIGMAGLAFFSFFTLGFAAKAVELTVTADDFEPRTFTDSRGESLPYRLFVPKNYDQSKSYPLIVTLHGGQKRGNDNRKQATLIGARIWIEPANQAKNPCFVFAPQCPSDSKWGLLIENPKIYSAVRSLLEAIDALEKEFKIDRRRIYITGHSMGGTGLYSIIATQPDRFAAAVPLSGRLDWGIEDHDFKQHASLFAHVPIWTFHGGDDPRNDPDNSRRMAQAIKELGGNPKCTILPGKEHDIPPDVYPMPELHEWLFAQRLPDSIPVGNEVSAKRAGELKKLEILPVFDRIKNRFVEKKYKDGSGRTLAYQFLVPKQYDPSKSYPLALSLHSRDKCGDDNKAQLFVMGTKMLSHMQNQAINPCFVVVPQCPKGQTWEKSEDGLNSPFLQCALNILDLVEKDYSIDSDRIYIVGCDIGGSGVWEALAMRPGYFAAALTACGQGDPSQAEAIAKTPVWAFHGSDDKIVDPQKTRFMVKALENAGGKVRYTEFPGVGHGCWYEAFSPKETYEWLISQTRSNTVDSKTKILKTEGPGL